MSRFWARCLAAALVAVSLAVIAPRVVSAHPLGNFTVNQYSGIVVRSNGVDVNYVLDMAEIPTAQLLAQLNSDEGHLLTGSAADGYRAAECAALDRGISLHIDSAVAPLTVAASVLSFPPGAAGLHTLRLTCRFTTRASPVGHGITYLNRNFDDRVGWREITAAGASARLAASSVPRVSVSAQLTGYPTDLLTSPLDVRGATISVIAGQGGAESAVPSGPASILPRGVDQFTNAFVETVARQDLNVPFALLALVLALVLGGVHALAPGHGKTVMAAYLVGQRGSLRHAAALAGSVTVTHTIGVLALGIALSVSTSFAPAQIYPLLGMASGLIIVFVGVSLLLRAWRVRSAREVAVVSLGAELAGSASHAHEHGAEVHVHGGKAHTHPSVDPHAPRLRSVLAIGFAGGMVPSPSALVVLVGGIALHRTWFAVLLVIVYGAGMAVVLIGAGVALRHARTLIDRRVVARRAIPARAVVARLAAAVPLITAGAVVLVGLGLTLRGVGAL